MRNVSARLRFALSGELKKMYHMPIYLAGDEMAFSAFGAPQPATIRGAPAVSLNPRHHDCPDWLISLKTAGSVDNCPSR